MAVNLPMMEMRLPQAAIRNQRLMSMVRMGPIVMFNEDMAFRHQVEVIDGKTFRMRTPFLPHIFKDGWNRWFRTHGDVNEGVEYFQIV